MKDSIKLPLFIALCHIPIFFIQIHHVAKKKEPHKKIQINTINLIQEKPVHTYKKETLAASAKPLPTPPKKEPAVKKQPPKKPKKTISKTKIQKKLNKTLAKPKVACKTANKKQATKPQTQSVAKKGTKKSAEKIENEYNQYLSKVFELLSDELTLPEKGKVKLEITVRPSGSVAKIVSVLSESDENLSYLQENIKGMRFPPYTKKEDRTFTIVFSDEK